MEGQVRASTGNSGGRWDDGSCAAFAHQERVAMEIRCRCSACQTKFKVDAKYAGKKARCPKCQQIVDVPLESVEGSTVSSFPAVGGSHPAGLGTGIGNSAVIPPRSAAPVPGRSAVFSTPPSAAAPAAPAPGFPNLNLTSTKSAAGGAAVQTQANAERKKFSSMPLLVGGGLAVAILAGIGIVAMIAMNRPAGDGGTRIGNGGNVAGASTSDATLIINWADKERRGAGLAIDGRKEPIPASGEVKFTLPPGQHKILLQRRGFEPIEQSVMLARGASAQITPEWKPSSVAVATAPVGPATTIPPAGTPVLNPPASTDFPIGTGLASLTPAGFDGFVQNFELAKRQAQAGKKDILIVFACSDADRESQALASGLKTAQATQSLVGLVIDFPRSSEAFNLVEDRGQNEQMLDDFGVKSLPTVVLADDQGRAYFYKHEWDDGFDGLPAKLTQWQQQRAEVQQLLTEAQSGDGAAQLEAAAKAVKWVQDHKVWRSYGPEFTKWLNQAQQLDPENKQALLEFFFEPQWSIHSVRVNKEDSAAVSRVASLLDPWVARKFQDQDRGAKLHMQAAFLLAEVEQYDEATAQIEHAVKYQPKDAKLAEALADVKRRLESKDILGSGSGYLISSSGYVLTNHHVIEGEGRIEIRVPGTKDTVPAELIAHDAERDIALLKVAMPSPEKYQPIALAAEPVRRGAAVAAFGYPKGDTLGTGLKFTSGTISALPDEANNQMYLLDVTINPGNSGGPLCDRRGNVVGMITAKTLNDGFEDSYGLARPAAELVQFLDQHLPASTPRVTADPAGPALDWDQVDEKVSSGVLMILKKK
jgi:S1-C subfamily serine protease